MKKILCGGILFLMSASASLAAPAYGTRMPAKGKFHVGLQHNSILERKLEGVHSEYQSTQYFLQMSYGMTEWFSLDLKVGSGNITYYPDAGNKIPYASGFAGGYGFRIKAYDEGRAKGVVGFQHISVHPPSESVGTDKYEAILDDWQVSALGSYAFDKVTPYAGVKAGRMDYTFWVNEHDRNRVKSDETKMVGLVVGMDVDVSDNAWINMEAQFFDAQALSISLNLEF